MNIKIDYIEKGEEKTLVIDGLENLVIRDIDNLDNYIFKMSEKSINQPIEIKEVKDGKEENK